MRRRIAALAVAATVAAAPGATQAWAAGDCPALPPRSPMPIEAQPVAPAVPYWPGAVAQLDAKLPSLQLSSRQLVFVGDSITAGWEPGIFSQFYGARFPLLLGIGGDFTQGVLTRLPEEWGPMHPRLVVLLIGTNNIGHAAPEDIALGTAEIVRWIHRRSPDTRVLVVGLLPRGAAASDPVRQTVAQVNQMVARCADGRTTFFADIGRVLLDPAGTLSPQVSFDALHLTMVGYAIMATALEPEIKRIMGD